MKVFFVVGENSGDALAAPLIEALKKVKGDAFECVGVGGPRMKAVGFDELLPMDQISVIGLWEVLPKIPRLIKINKAIVEEIEKQQPDVVVTVDFPDFNFIIAKSLKKRGIYKGKVIHYVSPSVWAWRSGRAKKISEFLDGMMCLFPMEVDYYTKHGLKAVHVGHPLIESDVKGISGSIFRNENNIADDVKTIGLFFGSRESEFKSLSPLLKETARLVNEVEEGIRIIVPTLPSKEYEVQQLLEDFPLPVHVTANPNVKWSAFKACDAAVCVSGTVALELAYAGVPHVLMYKTNPVTALLLKILVKVKYAHLANILLDKPVVPEFLQGKCNPEKMAEEILSMFKNPEKGKEQVQEFRKLDILLGKSEAMTPSQKAAEFIINSVSG